MSINTNIKSSVVILAILIFISGMTNISIVQAEYDEGVNLIEVNPGFENGTSGWFTGGGAIDTAASEGYYSGVLVSAGSGNQKDWRSQGYSNISSGQKLQLSFDYKTSMWANGNPQVRFRFFSAGSSFLGESQRTLGLTGDVWLNIQIEAIVPDNTAFFDVFFTASTFGSYSGSVWLDNVAVNPWEDVKNNYVPRDATEGWSDESRLSWKKADGDLLYLLYLGNNSESVANASFELIDGDIDYDGFVGVMDLNLFVSQWLAELDVEGYPSIDIDKSGNIDLLDFSKFSNNWEINVGRPDVLETITSENTYKPDLELGNEYFWRVDTITNDDILTGVVNSFSCDDYLDFNIAAPSQIFYLDQSYLSSTQQVMFQSLQGLVARVKPVLFIRTNSNNYWLNNLTSEYKIGKVDISSINSSEPLKWAMNYFSSYYSSYILCDAYNDAASLSAAVCLAAVLPDSIIVDVTDQALMDSLGVPIGYDVRGKDEKWVWDQFKDDFSKTSIFVQRNDITIHGAYLRDLPITLGALTWWHDDLAETENVFSEFKANIPCFGWESPVSPGEDNAITFHSRHNMYTVVTDWMLNLSLFAGTASLMTNKEFKQPCSDNQYVAEDDVHYVSFCMSDMDNVNTIFSADGWAQNSQRFGSQYRGQFAMGWGMPPVMMKIGPTVMKWWYDNALETDCFIGYCSGLDYFHPSQFPELELHMSHLDKYMKQADLSTLCILDNYTGTLNSESYTTGQIYAQVESLRGMFLGYDHGGGQIAWFNGKPLVTGRYSLWANRRVGVCDTGANLAASINALPTDPYTENGYTFVIVHAWSYGWDEVADCISRLNDNVRVVTPNELIEQIYLHDVENSK